jgi:CPA1 family monovalent cation:H+ antiporter
VRRTAVWDAVQFTLNGIIFVLLGEQLPRIASGAAEVVQHTGHLHAAWLIVYVVAIFAALSALRFTWVWVSLRFTMFRAARTGQPIRKPGWQLLAVASLAGARGAITLAGVMSLPLTLGDGSPFPARDLAIFIAGGVIIVSLVAASVGLPLLLHGLALPPEPDGREEEDRARVGGAAAAIRAIEQQQHAMAKGKEDAGFYADIAARIMDDYRERIAGTKATGEEAAQLRKADDIEKALRLVAIRAERDEIFRLNREGQLPDDLARKLVRDVDLLETRYVTL